MAENDAYNETTVSRNGTGGNDSAVVGGKKDRNLVRLGVVGTAVMALCCFTPILVVGVAVVGLSAIVGWLDFVLFPALFFFIGLTVYAVHRQRCNLKERYAPEQG